VGFPILQGLSVLAVCAAVFLLSRERHETDSARALAFSTLVVASLAVILVNRSFSRSLLATICVKNGALLLVAGGAVALLAAVLFIPAGQRMFHFAPLHAVDLLLACAAGITCVFWFEAVKALRRR
jgi:Ca2+-transporting ATPase